MQFFPISAMPRGGQKESNAGISRSDKFGLVEMSSMGRFVLSLTLAFEGQLFEQRTSRGMSS